MRLAAKPSCYCPPISHLALMMQSDLFIIADNIRFGKSAPISRCRLKATTGMQWLTVPVHSHKQDKPLIRDIRIDNERGWRRKHFRQLEVNYRYAPFFEHYDLFFKQLYDREWTFLLDLNMAFLELICKALQISTKVRLRSEFQLDRSGVDGIIQLVHAGHADSYLCDATDAQFMELTQLRRAGISVSHPTELESYSQQFGEFIPNLSILDLLFNEGPLARNRLKTSISDREKHV